MTASSIGCTEEAIDVGMGTVHFLKKGNGAPFVVLHHSFSSHGWLPLYERLAERYTVYLPDLPGFGKSTRPEWARDVRDLAIIMLQFLDELGLDGVTLAGFGFGGWVAAEMATMNQRILEQLVLVGAAGIQPREGAIADQLVIDYVAYVQMGFEDQDAFNRHFGEDPPRETRLLLYGGREMTMRVTFKPWMFRRSLPHLLRGVRTPTLVVWGGHDRIIPLDSGRQYVEALPNARLALIEDAGHFVDFERPDQLAAAILETRVGAPA